MEVRNLPDVRSYKTLKTDELRESFLIENLFKESSIQMVYFDIERAIVGGAVPLDGPLPLLGSKKELGTEFFAERREIGIINIGGTGGLKADKYEFTVGFKDGIYVAKGTREIIFSSVDSARPAQFYFVSYPSHAACKTTLIKSGESFSTRLGGQGDANKRTINRYIHSDGVKSSQLVMGITELDEGSIWNTMPPHTHQRRTEIYFYFNMDENSVLFHIMGEPSETRHIVVGNRQGVVSPSWSIHAGCGTKNYSFIWSMGGENQDFEDIDAVDMSALK